MATIGEPPPETLEKYSYSPLVGPKFSFRLLQLLPGRRGSPIRINIDEFTFARDAHPPYEALSYTWGDAIDNVPIIVSKGELCWSLDVTRNCEEALGYLRLEKRPRRLWIDAICINQRDDGEKDKQVFNMIKIYRVARQVVAWLGPADATTNIAFKWFHTVNRNVTFSDEHRTLKLVRGGDQRYIARRGTAIVSNSERSALKGFFRKSWFTRLWIWQEVSCKTKHAILKCGGHVITWEEFSTSIRYLRGKRPLLMNYRLFTLIQGLSSAMYTHDLYKLMDAMRPAHCLDPKDRVYVAESLLVHHVDRLKPAYSKDWRAVYTTWAEERIAHGDLDFLEHAGASQANTDLPSWVPDWLEETRPVRFERNFAHGGADAVCHLPKEGCLSVSGVEISEVQTVVEFHSTHEAEGFVRERDVTNFLNLLVSCALDEDHTLDDLTRFIWALNAGHIAERYVPRFTTYPNLDLIRTELNKVISVKQMRGSREATTELYKMLAIRLWHGRAFFKTQSGRFGLCPASSKAGDKVVILLGSDVPMVIRLREDGGYVLVGPAYCEGIMSAEAILGPLPDSVECVNYRVKGFRYIAFKDKTTKRLSYTDPRLPSLPVDWEVVTSKDTPYFLEYKHVRTGEIRDAWTDPRCDIDALKARGVKVETFVLV